MSGGSQPDSGARLDSPPRPAFVAVAHGTRSEPGTAMVRQLIDGIRAAQPALDVREAWIEAREPDLPTALAAVDGPAVVVPLLLSVGYHLRVDLPAALAQRPATVLTRALGPDPLAATAMADRLRAARVGHDPARTTVLVAAGSSDPDALDDLRTAVALLEAELGRPVRGAVMTAAAPLLPDALAGIPAADSPIEIANYLLADGYFARQMIRQAAAHGVRIVAAPLGAHPAMIALALARYGEGERDLRAAAGM